MPLDSGILSTAIQGKLSLKFPDIDGADWSGIADAVAEAVVEHIVSSAVLVVTGVVMPAGTGTGTVV